MSDDRRCSIANCCNPVEAKGLCNAHYRRKLRLGDPLAGGTPKGAPLAFFENVVLPYDGEDCLIWPFSRTGHGYALVWHGGRMVLVSRLICEHVHGPAPTPEHQAAHICGKGGYACVTRQHLRWASPKENQADRFVHGTLACGERHGNAKLTEADVRAIKAMSGAHRDIAAKFGVAQTTISKIKAGKAWRHIGELFKETDARRTA